MSDGRTARPVSGEIMEGTAALEVLPRPQARADVIDADFETVLAAEADCSFPQSDAVSAAPGHSPAAGMEILRKDRKLPRRNARPFSRRGGPAFWVFGLGLALAAFWISGGHALLRRLPFPEAARVAPAFTISGVKSRVDTAAGRPILYVDGEATNDGNRAALLPALEIRVTGEDGRATFYKLGTSQTPLAPGGRFAFSSRLAVPKNGVKTVAVAFGD